VYKYVLQRILLLIPVLFCVVFIVFTILNITPGDPTRLILGPASSPEQRELLTKQLNLDKPFFQRFFTYTSNILTKGDFGVSYISSRPVVEEMAERFPVTIILAIWSLVISTIAGISLGVLSAIRQYSVIDTIFTVTAMLLSAVPYFWLGLMLMLVFGLKLGWVPIFGLEKWTGYILPVTVNCFGAIAGLLRLTRSTMLETIRQDYIRTARAKGASEKDVIWRHALKNALLPVITYLGGSFSTMLGGAVIVETIFSLPGMGTYILAAIKQRNAPVIMSGTLVLAAVFCLIMLVVDLLYAFIDPRIKARYAKLAR